MSSSAPRAVPGDYTSKEGLEARRAAYRDAAGPDARELLFEAVAAARPRRFLEVGCGPGELASRVQAGRELLREHFARVDELDASGTVTFRDRDAVVAYVEASRAMFAEAGEVPELPAPLVARRRPVVFVARKAA